MLRNNEACYGRLSQSMHAIIALLVIGLLIVGAWMTGLDKTNSLKRLIYTLHKLTGLTTFLVGLIFIVWGALNLKPRWPLGMPRWEQIAATAIHHTLKLILLLMPMSGWLMSTAVGYPPRLGALVLPIPGIPRSEAWANFGGSVHYSLAWLFSALLALHVAASLKHHFQEKDSILKRMWFGS